MNDARERLERLLGFLEQDPDNAALLRDTAEAALAASDPQIAGQLFIRLRDLGELSVADSNLWAIAAMRSGDPQSAARTFEGLLQESPGDPALTFNLAWSRALAKDFEGALSALDEDTVQALPQAAQLEVQLLHQAGELERAEKRARAHLARHGDYAPLLAAVSVLAMDVEDEALARQCAEAAGAHPDAQTTLGLLALEDREFGQARALFEGALAVNEHSPRAWIGLGLADLADGKAAKAAGQLDRGAGQFGDHLGSWIAAGWAWLLAGDRAKARERFEHALAIDPNFGEAQGSLAMIEMLEGQADAAKRRADVASRLDRNAFSAALVHALLNAGAGNADAAQRIVEKALSQPIGAGGRTIAEALARLAR